MRTVYALSAKGQQERSAHKPNLPSELGQLLRLIDGRSTDDDLLASLSDTKSAVKAGGLRWLKASGYIVATQSLAPPPPKPQPKPGVNGAHPPHHANGAHPPAHVNGSRPTPSAPAPARVTAPAPPSAPARARAPEPPSAPAPVRVTAPAPASAPMRVTAPAPPSAPMRASAPMPHSAPIHVTAPLPPSSAPMRADPPSWLPTSSRPGDMSVVSVRTYDEGADGLDTPRMLADYMRQAIGRWLDGDGYRYQRQLAHAVSLDELLPHLNPLIDAIVAKSGPEAGAEFADTAAFILNPRDTL